jgi:organic radical activating enzyme
MLWVTEIFKSIQGEGLYVGTPSNFVRLAGCHLRCSFCDTKYSLTREAGKAMKEEKIIKLLDESIKLVTITGGEPLLQDIRPLCKRIKERGQRIIVETSGTIRPNRDLRELIDVFSVSPKLSNSGQKLKYDFSDDWGTYYKFVILNPERDLKEVEEFVKKHGIKEEKVIVQPDGNRIDYANAIRELEEALISFRLNYKLIPQLHRIINVR